MHNLDKGHGQDSQQDRSTCEAKLLRESVEMKPSLKPMSPSQSQNSMSRNTFSQTLPFFFDCQV